MNSQNTIRVLCEYHESKAKQDLNNAIDLLSKLQNNSADKVLLDYAITIVTIARKKYSEVLLSQQNVRRTNPWL
jgi:hypothetical protein